MAHYGNLQKIRNGKRTFAITPHIPGGFIKPDVLIKLAAVAERYGGIIKITSGQRILITNLKEEDLPAVWDELGMKPAIVTQNSLKNVEMCPSNFCKRSKYPTLGIGMKLSRAFQGMELPCRTKIGVAGCRNSCGSVYAKDIGVLVDFDKLFFVTVGGSAGFYPRMADIVTRGLTEDQAFALVEVILNYYKENALMGEKLGDFIDRITIDKFRDEVLEIAQLEKKLETEFK